MSKKVIIAILAVAALIAAVYFLKKDQEPVPVGGDNNSTETTASAGTYTCTGGKSFVLTKNANGTASVKPAGGASTALHKSSAGIWISSDAKVAVREIANYTILVQNDVTTHDQCHLK